VSTPTAQTIAARILQHQESFTRKERTIARVLTTGYPTAGLETVAELGRRAEASGATILRFIGKLGFASYPEFQEALRDELTATLESPLARYQTPDARVQEGDTLAQYANWAGLLLRQASGMIPVAEFDAVVQLLENEKAAVHLIGGRFSRPIAEIFAYGLMGVRPHVHLVSSETRRMVNDALEIHKKDIVVVFDFRRYQDNVIEFATIAREAEATLIVFTDKWQSPAAKLADHVFALPVAGPSVYDSALATVMCIEALISRLAEGLGNRAERRVARIEELHGRLAE
jgi:DNA-binding MurR/RpiR family transcriptional regulator